MRTLLSLMFALLLAATSAHAQLEECPDLPQEGEGYYPAFAPPFNVDTTNGGWNSDPPRFLPLDDGGDELCGSLFRYQDGNGQIHNDEDWFELMSLDMNYWVLQVWTDGDLPFHYRLTDDQGNVEECATIASGRAFDIMLWSGYHRFGLTLVDGAPLHEEVAWRVHLSTPGTWDPLIHFDESPASATPISPPCDEETYNCSDYYLAPADLVLDRLWQPWQGDFEPGRTASASTIWYRLSLAEATGLLLCFTSGYQGDVLVFQADGDTPGDLVLGGSTSCRQEVSLAAAFPAGDWFVAVSGTAVLGWGRLQIEALPCLPPEGLHIQRLGAAVELAWEAAPNATHYRVLEGDTPENLTQIAVVAEPRFVDTRALSHAQRWYQVVAICP